MTKHLGIDGRLKLSVKYTVVNHNHLPIVYLNQNAYFLEGSGQQCSIFSLGCCFTTQD